MFGWQTGRQHVQPVKTIFSQFCQWWLFCFSKTQFIPFIIQLVCLFLFFFFLGMYALSSSTYIRMIVGHVFSVHFIITETCTRFNLGTKPAEMETMRIGNCVLWTFTVSSSQERALFQFFFWKMRGNLFFLFISRRSRSNRYSVKWQNSEWPFVKIFSALTVSFAFVIYVYICIARAYTHTFPWAHRTFSQVLFKNLLLFHSVCFVYLLLSLFSCSTTRSPTFIFSYSARRVLPVAHNGKIGSAAVLLLFRGFNFKLMIISAVVLYFKAAELFAVESK